MVAICCVFNTSLVLRASLFEVRKVESIGDVCWTLQATVSCGKSVLSALRRRVTGEGGPSAGGANLTSIESCEG